MVAFIYRCPKTGLKRPGVHRPNPEVILGQSAEVMEALQSATRMIPIVFLHVADPGGLRLRVEPGAT
jgi:ABC-type uncharacterized transport system substrate-binding protein